MNVWQAICVDAYLSRWLRDCLPQSSLAKKEQHDASAVLHLPFDLLAVFVLGRLLAGYHHVHKV